MQNTVINIDWLSFSLLMNLTEYEQMHGAELACPIGYTLQEYSGTNMYKRRHILYTYEGEKVMTLLHQPYSKIIHPASLFVEVANKYLYQDITPIIQLLPQIHSAQWQSLSRLDVCGDINPTQKQYHTIEQLGSGAYYITGKREGAQFHDYNRHEGEQARVERLPRQMSWGSKQSEIKVKLYNKTLEIYEPSPTGALWCTKPYIVDNWRANGLDPNKVWRLEWSIMSAGQYQLDGKRLSLDTTNAAAFTRLFWDLTAVRFQPRVNEGHTAKRYDRLVDFLDIPDMEHYRLRKVEPQSQRRVTAHAATLRNLMKELAREEIRATPAMRDTILRAADAVIRDARLDNYFLKATGKHWTDWVDSYLAGEYVTM